MNRLRIYLRERFPLLPTALHALSTGALLVGVSAARSSERLWVALCIAVCFFFFMLRMRVTDEFKDAGHDDAHYPDRPVQRGVIFKRDLVVIGIVALILEFAGAVLAGVAASNSLVWVWYLPVFGYSILTGREFFVPAYLERHFNLYFVVHQAIFVLWLVWAFSIFEEPVNLSGFGAAIAFFLLMISMEIVRKYEIRRNPAGEVVQDTYLAVWGHGAFWVLVTNLVFSSVLLYLGGSSWLVLAVGGLFLTAMFILRRRDSTVRALAAASFLLTSFVVLFS